MLKEELIKTYNLQSHPEGGYYKETYRSKDVIETNSETQAQAFPNGRSFATAIYFLIEKNNFSAFHKIKSDETWHFYEGDALEVIEIDLEGNLIKTKVGRNIGAGEVFQYTVKAGHWFGSRVLEGGEYSFVGCTVAPGFDFRDFEIAKRKELQDKFPQHAEIIAQLTRE